MNIFKEVAAKKYKLAVWSMALGLMGACLSLVVPGVLPLIFGLLALIFAVVAKKDYFSAETATHSTIGLVTGIVATVISGLTVLIPLVMVLIVVILMILYLILWVLVNMR